MDQNQTYYQYAQSLFVRQQGVTARQKEIKTKVGSTSSVSSEHLPGFCSVSLCFWDALKALWLHYVRAAAVR